MAATDPTRLPDDLRGAPERVTIANINADPARRQRAADLTSEGSDVARKAV
jgi:hypothetical protein